MLLGGSLFLTSVWGWSPLVAGLGFAVGPGTAVAAALLAGRTRLSPRWLAGLGSALFVLGGALWALLLGAGAESVPVMFAGLAVTGAGAGVAQTGFLAGGVSPLPPESYATGTGVLNTARQIGSALGVAALIAIVGAGTNASSYQLAWIVLSCSGLAGVLSALLIRGRSRGAGTTADAGDAASVRPIDVEV